MEDIEHIEKEMKLITADGRRLDGRKTDELRPVRIKAGGLGPASGPALRENRWGRGRRPEQGKRQFRGRRLPHGDRPADGRDRAPPDGRTSPVRRVPKGDGDVDRRDAPPL